MPSIRVGFSTDLNITGGKLGIGTTNPTADLEVAGQITAERAAGAGEISTFKEYQGFSQSEARISNNITIDNSDGGPFSSLTGEIKITGETTVSSGSTVEVGKTKTLTVTDRFAVPLGETNNRDNTPEAGTTRFNQDFGTLEFFDGVSWKTVNSYSRGGTAGRAILESGYDGAQTNMIEYHNMVSGGDSKDFGEMAAAGSHGAGCSNGTRGVFATGTNSPGVMMDYVTIASEGDSIDFGDLATYLFRTSAHASSTRGIWMGGRNPGSSDVIQYAELATTGNTIDFGDLTVAKKSCNSAMGTPTRAFLLGGGDPYTDSIESVTISSLGDAVKTAELTYTGGYLGACSTSTRGFGVSGYYGPGSVLANIVSTVNIVSDSNAVEWGEDTVAQSYSSVTSTATRGVRYGGLASGSTRLDSITYFSTTSAGNTIDFGNLSVARYDMGCCSDSHGGLGGF